MDPIAVLPKRITAKKKHHATKSEQLKRAQQRGMHFCEDEGCAREFFTVGHRDKHMTAARGGTKSTTEYATSTGIRWNHSEDNSDPNKPWNFTVGTPALITTSFDVPLTKEEVSPFYSNKKSDLMQGLVPRIHELLSLQTREVYPEEGGMDDRHS